MHYRVKPVLIAAVVSLMLPAMELPALAQAPAPAQTAAPAPAQNAVPAQAGAHGSVAGTVVDRINGLRVPDAQVVLFAGATQAGTTKSDAGGLFRFPNVPPGVYVVQASGAGYAAQSSANVAVLAGQEAIVTFALTRAAIGYGGLKTVATTRSSAGSAIAATTTITRTLDTALIAAQGYTRFGDQLRTLPGVNLAGLSSSVGDDLYINIRGIGESETQALLDGHPVGPVGVYAINGGGGNFPSSFNFANSPFFGLNKVDVTFGSGATGLYGTDAIGGTINMETLVPTRTQHSESQFGTGTQGQENLSFSATGTLGRLGYAAAGGVQGSYGMFTLQTIPQTARPNNNSSVSCLPNPPPSSATTPSPAYNFTNLTSCNLASNTYPVSQNVLVRAGLAKLTYALSPNTSIAGTWYGSGQWADSTGNGDNDNNPYDTRLAQVTSQQPGASPLIQCALPGDTGTKKSGLLVAVDNNPQACYSAAQIAANSFGPSGGGEGRARGTNMFDYHTRLTSVSGHSTYTVDYFFNHYKYTKTSETANGPNPDGTCCAGTVYSQFLNTQGLLFSDEIATEKSDIGFGYFVMHQEQTRLNFQFTGQGQFSYVDPAYPAYGSVFAKGAFDFNPHFSAYANAWLKRSNVDKTTSFDPRLSLVFRPTARDVARVTYGQSTGDPAAELVEGGVTINGNPSSLNPSCTPYNSVGSGSNPAIKPERGTDYELGFAHAFRGDSQVQLNLYSTKVQEQLFAANLPLTSYPGGASLIAPNLLMGFASKIAGAGCPGVSPSNPASVIPFLSISTTFNAASAIYNGLELSGRQRFSNRFYADYSLDFQSARQFGVSDNILQNNPFIINGNQILAIPWTQANLALNYSTPQGWEAEADGYYTGSNNVSARPAYSFWSGFVGKTLSNQFTIRVGVFNIFNQATQNYGYFGHQLLFPENRFGPGDTNSIQQYVNTGSGEEFGLASRSVVLTLSRSI